MLPQTVRTCGSDTWSWNLEGNARSRSSGRPNAAGAAAGIVPDRRCPWPPVGSSPPPTPAGTARGRSRPTGPRPSTGSSSSGTPAGGTGRRGTAGPTPARRRGRSARRTAARPPPSGPAPRRTPAPTTARPTSSRPRGSAAGACAGRRRTRTGCGRSRCRYRGGRPGSSSRYRRAGRRHRRGPADRRDRGRSRPFQTPRSHDRCDAAGTCSRDTPSPTPPGRLITFRRSYRWPARPAWPCDVVSRPDKC